MGKDSGKTLIPLYFDMDKSDLSDDFAHMPSYDMKTDGFEQDLIRGIKKLIPLPVMLLEKRKRRNKILKRIGLAVAACAVIGAICAVPWFMKLPDYNAAMQLYYDKNYPEATWAFADLGSYRNSDEMKEKCESSWRKSLAVVITDTYDGARFNGTYYIDNKGTNTIADDTIQELDTADKLITPESSSKYRNSFFTFYQIAEGRYDRSSDASLNDFGIMNDVDCSYDLYGYLYGYFEKKRVDR